MAAAMMVWRSSSSLNTAAAAEMVVRRRGGEWMADWKRRVLGMGVPCLLAFLLDSSLTLHGQPAEYWAGNYTHTTEGAPFMRRLYMIHPLAAVAGYLVWAGLMFGLLVLLPEVLAVILSIAIVFGHVAGAYTWMLPITVGWYQTVNGMFLVTAIVLGVGLHWSLRAPVQTDATSTRRLPTWLRWGLITLFFGTGCSMIFAPW
jgi:hypothetical protein